MKKTNVSGAIAICFMLSLPTSVLTKDMNRLKERLCEVSLQYYTLSVVNLDPLRDFDSFTCGLLSLCEKDVPQTFTLGISETEIKPC